MRTISEMQKKIRDMAEEMEELSRELAAFRSNPADARGRQVDLPKIEALGVRYPIRGHCLRDRPAGVQKQYLTLLAGLLLAEPAHGEAGWLLLRRIAAGGEVSRPLTDFLADAASMTPRQMDVFTQTVSQHALGDALLLDGMILYLAMQGGETARFYLSGLAELLCCSADRIRRLTAWAAAIAENHPEKLRQALSQSGNLNLSTLLCWAREVFQGPFCFCPGPGQIWLEGDEKTPIPPAMYRALKEKTFHGITIRGGYFTQIPLRLSAEPDGWLFLENCRFEEISTPDNGCFGCRGFYRVEIRNCLFRDLSAEDNAIEIQGVQKLLVCRTEFQNISSQRTSRGWAIQVSVDCEARFEHVSMENIRASECWYHGSGTCTAEACTYHNCKGRLAGSFGAFQGI